MVFLIALGGWVIALSLLFIISTILTKRRHQGPGNWPKTTGRVIRAFVYRHERRTPGKIDVTYTPFVEYTYSVEDQIHVSHKLDFVPYYLSTYRDVDVANAIVESAPVGSAVQVYYNPNNPQQAVLQTQRPKGHNAVLLYGFSQMAMGILSIVLALVIRW